MKQHARENKDHGAVERKQGDKPFPLGKKNERGVLTRDDACLFCQGKGGRRDFQQKTRWKEESGGFTPPEKIENASFLTGDPKTIRGFKG